MEDLLPTTFKDPSDLGGCCHVRHCLARQENGATSAGQYFPQDCTIALEQCLASLPHYLRAGVHDAFGAIFAEFECVGRLS
mmetsp:Transcript_20185/g.24744  ORF Transcript_20185/g.24744 Transcript_20185/m.24744 type:complete len:81 (+) Transcript_20185:257-499(+)